VTRQKNGQLPYVERQKAARFGPPLDHQACAGPASPHVIAEGHGS